MSVTISVYQGKGGVGKTTATVFLARLWHEQKPLIIDLDPQRNTHAFESVLQPLGISIFDAELDHFYSGEIPSAPILLIDCPPTFALARAALEGSDIILMPFSGAGLAWELSKKAWGEVLGMKRKGPTLAFMSSYNPGEPTSRTILAEARELYGPALLPVVIRTRAAFGEAALQGQTIFETAPESPAAKQYRNLSNHLQAIINQLESP